MMNQVNLIGRLTRDPELRYTSNGVAVASTTLAVQRDFKNAEGEYEADFISLVLWRSPAETFSNYLVKGDRVGISGKLQSRSFENKEGNMQYVTEVNVENFTFIDSSREGTEPDKTQQKNNSNQNRNSNQNQNRNSNQNQNRNSNQKKR